MIAWAPFTYDSVVYDLSHLHPRTTTVTQSAVAGKPERIFNLLVFYSLHCFTRGIALNEVPDPALCYSDRRETRVFDFRRYELSKRLPLISSELAKRKCYHSGKGNFFVVELVDESGTREEYEVFFLASRSTTRGSLNLFVQSAYIRDQDHLSARPAPRKPIRFEILLYNVQTGKPIKEPR